MSDLVVVLVLGAIAIQIPLGILVYFDAKRRNLENPEMYWVGIIVPAGGFVVILYYFSERKDLPTTETQAP